MRRLTLLTLCFVGATACAAQGDGGGAAGDGGGAGGGAGAAGGGGAGGTPPGCQTLSGPASPTEVLRVLDRAAFDPDVHATPGGFVAYVGSLIANDGGAYRAESADGLTWTTPVRVLDEWGSALLLPGGVRFYYGRWEDRGVAPFQRIGSASSADGLTFVDDGIVWSGSGVLGADGLPLEHELTRPLAWFDGARVHLYFTAHGDRADSDMGFSVSSVGQAISDDGVSFVAAPWPFPAHPCVDPPSGPDSYESLAIWAAVRPSCADCAADGLSLVLYGRRCDGPPGTFLTHSADGTSFSEPIPLELPPGGGTLLVAGTEALYLFGGYEEQSVISAQAIALPAAPLTCQ